MTKKSTFFTNPICSFTNQPYVPLSGRDDERDLGRNSNNRGYGRNSDDSRVTGIILIASEDKLQRAHRSYAEQERSKFYGDGRSKSYASKKEAVHGSEKEKYHGGDNVHGGEKFYGGGEKYEKEEERGRYGRDDRGESHGDERVDGNGKFHGGERVDGNRKFHGDDSRDKVRGDSRNVTKDGDAGQRGYQEKRQFSLPASKFAGDIPAAGKRY